MQNDTNAPDTTAVLKMDSHDLAHALLAYRKLYAPLDAALVAASARGKPPLDVLATAVIVLTQILLAGKAMAESHTELERLSKKPNQDGRA